MSEPVVPPRPPLPPSVPATDPSPAPAASEPYVATAELLVQWAPASLPSAQKPRSAVAAWALAFAVLAVIVSLFVGWGFPIGFVGLVAGIIALRRTADSRAVALWAIALSVVSILYSAGWIVWVASRGGLLV